MLRRLLQPNLIRRAVAIAIGGGRYASTGFSRAAWLIWSRYYNIDLALGANATFTRAGTAYVRDHLGVYNLALANETRMEGARRVRNQATGLTTQTLTVVSGNTYQVTIKGTTGATCVCSNAFTGTLTASGTSRISWASGTPKTATSTSLVLTVTGTLTELQVENVTSRTLKVPSEYVSVSVLSDPYHGAGVDGVKYFPYANGNTVDANGVVTEANGAAINPDTIYLLQEASATNLYRPSLPVGFTVTTVTETVDASPGIFGPGSLIKLVYTPGTDGGSAWLNLNMPITGKAYCSLVLYIKKSASDPGIYPRFGLVLNGGTGQDCRFLFNNYTGEYYKHEGGAQQTVYVDSVGDFWKVTDVIANTGGNTTAKYYSAIAISNNMTSENVSTIANTIYISQIECLAAATAAELLNQSPIVTTTADVTRAADALAYSGVQTDNETLFTNKLGVETTQDDWNGTVPVPGTYRSIEVYNPGERP